MLFLPYLSCLNFDYSLFSLQTARCAMLTWEQSTRNEGKHPPLRACESLELPQLSLSLSLFCLSHSLVALRTQPLSNSLDLTCLDVQWLFTFAWATPYRSSCVLPLLGVLHRGGRAAGDGVLSWKRELSISPVSELLRSFKMCVWSVSSTFLTGRSFPNDSRCCIACFLYWSALLEQTSGG